MDMATAFQVVIELARQNVIDRRDDPEEHDRQMEAINVVGDIAVNIVVNQFGDD